jgi:hypothetical protein
MAMKIEGISAEIQVIRSARRSLAAEMTQDGKVLVRAPQRLPEQEIERFLREKSVSIERMVQKFKAVAREAEALSPFTYAEIEEMAQQALKVIPPRVKYYAEKLGVTYGRITIRNQKTRWGSCTAEGNLNFNCLLMKAPPEVLDSVVVHELCHRLHLNHSKAFYAEVYRVFPQYDRCHAWLKENGAQLIRRMTAPRES